MDIKSIEWDRSNRKKVRIGPSFVSAAKRCSRNTNIRNNDYIKDEIIGNCQGIEESIWVLKEIESDPKGALVKLSALHPSYVHSAIRNTTA